MGYGTLGGYKNVSSLISSFPSGESVAVSMALSLMFCFVSQSRFTGAKTSIFALRTSHSRAATSHGLIETLILTGVPSESSFSRVTTVSSFSHDMKSSSFTPSTSAAVKSDMSNKFSTSFRISLAFNSFIGWSMVVA